MNLFVLSQHGKWGPLRKSANGVPKSGEAIEKAFLMSLGKGAR